VKEATRRSARLLFAAERAAGTLPATALEDAAVVRAVRSDGTPPAPVRIAQRLAMKRGLIGYERTCAVPFDNARRAALGAAAAGPPRFLVRVDEFPHYRAHDEPGRYGTEAFAPFHEILTSAGVPYLMAALPTLATLPLDPAAEGGRALDAEEIATLRALGADGVAIALHGYDHRTRDAHPRRHSELSGLAPRVLQERLDAGEAVIEGIGLPRPRIFVAPFNRFDADQYPLLAERYDVVCGGPETVLKLGFRRTPLWLGDAVYLPAYAPLYGGAAEVLPAAEALIAARRALWVPIVLHWGWETDRGLEDLRALAATLAGHAASWDDFLAAVEASR